jgi:hypothetical protein
LRSRALLLPSVQDDVHRGEGPLVLFGGKGLKAVHGA